MRVFRVIEHGDSKATIYTDGVSFAVLTDSLHQGLTYEQALNKAREFTTPWPFPSLSKTQAAQKPAS